jgi:hypothetical protein
MMKLIPHASLKSAHTDHTNPEGKAGWTRLLRRWTAGLMLLTTLSAYLLVGAGPKTTAILAVDRLPKTLTLSIDATNIADSERRRVVVYVRAEDVKANGPVRLDIQSSLQVSRIVGTLRGGSESFLIPPTLLDVGSEVSFSASTEAERGSAHFAVPAGEPSSGVMPIVGPRHMIADGQHGTTVSVLSVDRANNALSENTPVTLFVRRPDGTETTIPGSVKGLLAGIHVPSGTRAGFTSIRVAIGKSTGPVIQVREVAGPPVPFALENEAVSQVANGRSLVEIRTARLADKFGNIVEDGTLVDLTGIGPDGAFKLTASTIDGRAVLRLRSPIRFGVIEAVARVQGVKSTLLHIAVGNDVAEFEVVTKRIGSVVNVTVGPVTSGLGGFVPDGTSAVFTWSDGQQRRVEIRDGFASTDLLVTTGDRFTVQVLGRIREGTTL